MPDPPPVNNKRQPHATSFPETLDDLAARFIANMPEKYWDDEVRIMFQIEQAHWYYEDWIRPNVIPSLAHTFHSYSLRQFFIVMLKTCDLLSDMRHRVNEVWDNFMDYKTKVPVCGAVLISHRWDKVLMVKGYKSGAAWSFPRGKINQDETEAACAVREVFEETGYDPAHFFQPSQLQSRRPRHYPLSSPSLEFQDGGEEEEEEEGAEKNPYYVETVIKDQKIRLYFLPGVREDEAFQTRTRGEISKIDWFRVTDLPTYSKKKVADGVKQPKFYMVTPFISHLKLWIDHNRPKGIPPPSSAPTPHSPSQPKSTTQTKSKSRGKKGKKGVGSGEAGGGGTPRPNNPTPRSASYTNGNGNGGVFDNDGTPKVGFVPLPPAVSHSLSVADLFGSRPTYDHSPELSSDDEEDEIDEDEISPSPSPSSSDPESADDRIALRRRGTFSTADEGTQALEAFFFMGGDRDTPPPPAEAEQDHLRILSSSTSRDEVPFSSSPPLHGLGSASAREHPSLLAVSPPQPVPSPRSLALAYERDARVLQPRPKATEGQRKRLLNLLMKNAVKGEKKAMLSTEDGVDGLRREQLVEGGGGGEDLMRLLRGMGKPSSSSETATLAGESTEDDGLRSGDVTDLDGEAIAGSSSVLGASAGHGGKDEKDKKLEDEKKLQKKEALMRALWDEAFDEREVAKRRQVAKDLGLATVVGAGEDSEGEDSYRRYDDYYEEVGRDGQEERSRRVREEDEVADLLVETQMENIKRQAAEDVFEWEVPEDNIKSEEERRAFDKFLGQTESGDWSNRSAAKQSKEEWETLAHDTEELEGSLRAVDLLKSPDITEDVYRLERNDSQPARGPLPDESKEGRVPTTTKMSLLGILNSRGGTSSSVPAQGMVTSGLSPGMTVPALPSAPNALVSPNATARVVMTPSTDHGNQSVYASPAASFSDYPSSPTPPAPLSHPSNLSPFAHPAPLPLPQPHAQPMYAPPSQQQQQTYPQVPAHTYPAPHQLHPSTNQQPYPGGGLPPHQAMQQQQRFVSGPYPPFGPPAGIQQGMPPPHFAMGQPPLPFGGQLPFAPPSFGALPPSFPIHHPPPSGPTFPPLGSQQPGPLHSHQQNLLNQFNRNPAPALAQQQPHNQQPFTGNRGPQPIQSGGSIGGFPSSPPRTTVQQAGQLLSLLNSSGGVRL